MSHCSRVKLAFGTLTLVIIILKFLCILTFFIWRIWNSCFNNGIGKVIVLTLYTSSCNFSEAYRKRSRAKKIFDNVRGVYDTSKGNPMLKQIHFCGICLQGKQQWYYTTVSHKICVLLHLCIPTSKIDQRWRWIRGCKKSNG